MLSTPYNYDNKKLEDMCRDLRLTVIDITTRAKSGHPSSCFSAVEIMAVLYFGGVMKYNPDDPWNLERDRFILSKGHAAPLLYSILAKAGFFDEDLLKSLREVGSPVQGHPIQGILPGIEATTGSLGQGLSLGIGHSLAGRLNSLDYNIFVLLGDGECEEGQIWEAAMAASHFNIDNLIAIVDYNKYQETGPISREMGLEPFAEKWKSFGWSVHEVNGHNIKEIKEKLNLCLNKKGSPSVMIAHTVKGKGVSFMEKDYTFHGRALTEEQAEVAKREILK